MERELRTIHAYHEAGHAVGMWLAGIPIAFASIMTERGGNPVVEPQQIAITPPHLATKKQLIVGVAGVCADRIHHELASATDDISGEGDDLKNVWMFLFELHGNTGSLDFYMDATDELLRKPAVWQSIEMVAEVLLRDKTVMGATLAELLARQPQLDESYWDALTRDQEAWWKRRI
ncbi:hypothetical protein ACC668_17775 [Rhizobium ruizarguesonis]|jgi:hypothetical protein